MKRRKERMKMQDLNLSGNKKGNAFLDSITLIIVLLVFGIISIISYNIFTSINTEIQETTGFSNGSKEMMTDLHTSFPSVFDSVFLVAMILFWIATIVASFMIDSHPIFFVATLLLLIFTIFFSAIVSNTFSEVTADESINADEFPITRFIMEYLPYFLLFIGFSVAIVLYGKYKREGLHLGM